MRASSRGGAALLAVVLACSLRATGAVSATLLAAGGTHPVPFPVNASVDDGQGQVAFASVTVANASAGGAAVLLLQRNATSTTGPWDVVSTLATGAVGNASCIQLPDHLNSSLACVFEEASTGGGSSLQLAVSADWGVTWAAPHTVASTAAGGGLWQPTIYLGSERDDAKPLIRVVYAAGPAWGAPGTALVQATSADGGATWSNATVVVPSSPGAGLASPGITTLSDGSLLLVFQTTTATAPPGGGGASSSVQSVRSFDGGRSWGQQVTVYAPPAGSGCVAGAPTVAVCMLTYKINVVFTTNTPFDGSACTSAASATTTAAPPLPYLGLVASFVLGANTSAPLNFTGAPLARIPTVDGGPAAAPSLYVDLQSSGARTAAAAAAAAVDEAAAPDAPDVVAASLLLRGAHAAPKQVSADIPTRTMRVAYTSLSPAGGAYLADGTICLS
jgi:hypothetical protein